MNYWPGFVDALSTLILGIIFLLTVFVVVQFFLTQEVTGKDTALTAAQRADRAAHRAAVAGEDRQARASRSSSRSCAPASARAEAERDRFKGLYEGVGSGAAEAQGKVSELAGQLDAREEADRARAGAGRGAQPADRGAAPPARRARRGARCLREEGQGRAGPHRRSRPAAQRGAGAARAGAVALPLRLLRPAARHPRQPARHPHRRRPLRVPVGGVLRHRPGGAQARGPRRARQARRPRCSSSSSKIPAEIAWVLRVDGHTDVRPINSPQFKTNWELSAARAISVVQYLISKGVSPQRLVAAGFGEFQPIDAGADRRGLSAATAASS